MAGAAAQLHPNLNEFRCGRPDIKANSPLLTLSCPQVSSRVTAASRQIWKFVILSLAPVRWRIAA